MSLQTNSRKRVAFGDYELDCRTLELRHDGKSLKLQPQPAKVLSILISQAGEVVTRQELAVQVWGSDRFVDFEHGLNFAIQKIRRVLEDDVENPRYLETVPKRGYRFIAAVSDVDENPSAHTPLSSVAPERRNRRVTAFFLAAGLLLAIAGASYDLQRRVSRNHKIGSLAVLPLRNLSGDPDQEYFSDGMTDELITALANSQGLRVISHTSVERYKGTKRPLPEIARELGVDAIVEGTVTHAEDRVRITAQLIDARSDQHVWADRYEGAFRDVLSLQDEVARQVAREVGTSLNSPQSSSGAHKVEPAAYEAYLKGVFYFGQMRCSTFRKALASFQEAVDKDPTYAPAYSGLADSYFEFSDWRCSQEATIDKAQAAALKAIALDPASADSHEVLAKIAFSHEWNWARAAVEFDKAMQLDPNDAGIHASYGTYLVAMGYEEQGLAEMRKAHQIDPVSEKTNVMYSTALFMAHRFDDTIAQARQALDLSPHQVGQYYWLGEAYEKKGLADEAITSYLGMWESGSNQSRRRRAAYQNGGLPEYWREDERYRGKTEKLPIDAFLEAMYYSHFGENGKALGQLKLAYRQHCDGLQFLKVDPHFDQLRDNSDFKALLAQLAL